MLKLFIPCPCRFVAMRCAGFDRVDVDACVRRGIAVVRVPTYSPHSVAEHAVAMLLCLNRHISLPMPSFVAAVAPASFGAMVVSMGEEGFLGAHPDELHRPPCELICWGSTWARVSPAELML